MKHQHADLMREWALDTSRVVQYASMPLGEWKDCEEWPLWGAYLHYRFKPEPKPEPKPDYYYVFATILDGSLQLSYGGQPNVKFTFDGETHQLKAAEVLK